MLFKYENDSYNSEGILLSDAKSYLKVTNVADDAVIQQLIDGIVIHAERFTGYQIREGDWSAYSDCFELEMELRKTNIETINSIEYVNSLGVVTTVDQNSYYLDSTNLYSTIKLKNGYSWPNDVMEIKDAVRIKFTTSINERYPEILVHMLRHLAFAYENRGDDGVNPSFGVKDSDFYKSVSFPLF